MIDKMYKFNKILEYLKSRNNISASLISVYIPFNKAKDAVIRQLENELSIQPTKHMRKTLAYLIDLLNNIEIPKNGICLFAGTTGDEDNTVETIAIKPLYKLKKYRYICEESYDTDPLEKMEILWRNT